MSPLNLDYHYGKEAEQYSFYRIPKLLFYDPHFEGLSLEAKLLYGLMLDRMSLSIQNNWADEYGRIYIYFTMDDACNLLGIGRTKMVRIMAELDRQKGVGLIERRKQGQGKPTVIYVKNFTSLPLTALKPQEVRTKSNIKTAPKATPQQAEYFSSPSESCDSPSENRYTPMQNTVCEHPRHSQNETLDVRKRNTNKTNLNQTELNDTESLSPSSPLSTTADLNYGVREGGSLADEVIEALYQQGGLPYAYTQDEYRMTEAIHLLTEYELHCQNATLSGGDPFRHTAFCLFNQALIQMLTSKKTMELRGSCVTYAKVYEKLKPYISVDFGTPVIMELPEIAIGDYMKACREREIKHHLAYMKSCIWYVMQVGDINLQAQIHRDFA